MANNFKNPWDVGGEHYNQNALNTQFLPEGFLETKQSYQEWKAEREQDIIDDMQGEIRYYNMIGDFIKGDRNSKGQKKNCVNST